MANWMLFLLFVAPYCVYGDFTVGMDCSDPCTVSAGSKMQLHWSDAPPGKLEAMLGWRNSKTRGISIIDVTAMDPVDGTVGSATANIYSLAPPGDYYYWQFYPENNNSEQRTLGPFTITGGDTNVSLINKPSTWQVELFCFAPCVGGSTPAYSGDWLRLHLSNTPSDIGNVDVSIYWGDNYVTALLLDEPVNETMYVLLPWDDKAPPGGSYHITIDESEFGHGYITTSLPFELSNEVITSNPKYTPPPNQQILGHVDHVPEHLKAKPQQEGNAATIRTTIWPLLIVACVAMLLIDKQ